MYNLKTVGFPYQEFALKTGAYRLGTAKDNEIVLEDPSVSAHHCEIVVTANTIMMRDLSSTHETYVDDQKVESTRLQPGQSLRLGNLTLILRGDDPAAIAAASPPAKVPGAAPTVPKARGRFPKVAPWTGLAMVVAAGIAYLIYSNRSSPGQPSVSEQETGDGEPSGSKSKSPTARKEGGRAAETPTTDNSSKDDDSPEVTARQAQQERLQVWQKAFDPKELNRPPDLDVQAGELRLREGDFPRAEPFLERALRNQQKNLGSDHPEVTKTLGTLGDLYRNTRQYDKAEPALQQVLRNALKLRGRDHPETAQSLDQLGKMYLASGQQTKASPLLDLALKIRENSLPPDHRDLAASLNNVAAMHASQGDYAKSKPLLERALKIFEKTLGPDDPKLAPALDNLAEICRATAEPEKAEQLLQKALSLKERALPPDDPSIVATLKNLAALHSAKGDNAKAEPLLQRALEVCEKAFGPDHPETAACLKNLAQACRKQGNAEKAAPLFQRAADAAEKTLGPEHPQTEVNLSKLAEIHGCEGDPRLGADLAKQAVRAKYQLLAKIVRYGSEQQRLAYRERLNPYSLAASLDAVPELASAILRCKGVVLDSLLEDRLIAQAGSNPELRNMIGKLSAMKGELAKMLFELPEDLSPNARERRQADVNNLTTLLKVLESDLERLVPGTGRARRALNLTLDKVKAEIPSDTVLLEWVRYSRCVKTNQWEPSYGVVVIGPIGDPKWVSLGSAKRIDENIASCERSIEGPAAASSSASPNPAEQALSVSLKALYQQLWAPIENSLPAAAKTVIISPDAALNFVSFATLLTPSDQFLSEKYSIRYVASGRDLLEERKPLRKGPIFVFGNPDFSVAMTAAAQNSNTNLTTVPEPDPQVLHSLRLSPLPTAAQEVALIHLQAMEWNWPVTLFFGANASESELGAVKSARILHLATRGFVLLDSPEESETEEPQDVPRIEPFNELSFGNSTNRALMSSSRSLSAEPAGRTNPLHRSGVALAGAQATLQAWERGETPQPSHDGILTADGVGTLKLEGTELVVLSAFDNETGSIRSGEGLRALRRAFAQAGAKNFLVVMRRDGDEGAARMMAHFYRRFNEIGNAARALAEVQRDWLVRLRKESGLRTAVRSVGPFIMSSQGAIQ